MNLEDIIGFLKSTIEPIEDQQYGLKYRTSVYLKDGTYLPAVVFLNPERITDLAIRRFEEEKLGRGKINWGRGVDNYRRIVSHFITKGNRINEYDIDRVTASPYAFSKDILNTIKGETSMSWTGFTARMSDGNVFAFGTTFLFEFFQMPEGYTSKNIIKIMNHSYISKNGELKFHEVPFSNLPEDYDESLIFRERPYFNCYIRGL